MGSALTFMDIEPCYRDMAADQAREQEALEWSEGVIADQQTQLATDEHG